MQAKDRELAEAQQQLREKVNFRYWKFFLTFRRNICYTNAFQTAAATEREGEC